MKSKLDVYKLMAIEGNYMWSSSFRSTLLATLWWLQDGLPKAVALWTEEGKYSAPVNMGFIL